MAINNHTTASSSALARTDTPQPTAPQPPAQGHQPPRLHVVEPRASASPFISASTSPVTVTQAPQLQASATPNSPRSQLRAAARDGDGTTIKRLIASHKPDIGAPDPATGMTALMLAASEGHDDVVFLLTKGMQAQDIHRQTPQGDTALTLAAARGHADVVNLLLSKGAQQAHKNVALASAAAAGQDDMISLLLQHGALSNRPTDETRPRTLMQAASAGDAAHVAHLLADGAGTDNTDDEGWTALHNAAWHGHDAIVSLLLSSGADCNRADNNGATPLILASGAGRLATAQALLDAGADLAHRDHTGKAAIDMARDMGHRLLAMALSSAQETAMAGQPAAHKNVVATITATTTASSSTTTTSSAAPARSDQPTRPVKPATLLTAVKANDAQALARLLVELEQAGKDVVAEVNRVGEIDAQNLRTNVRTEATALLAAAYYGHREVIELLLNAGAEVDPATRGAYSALMFAAMNGHTPALQALLQAGATVDQARTDDMTALMMAAKKGHTDALQALLRAGAKVDQAQSDGMTALMMAAHNGHTATLQALLQAGANCDLKNKSGNTALNISRRYSRAEIIKLLLAHGADTGSKFNHFSQGWFG